MRRQVLMGDNISTIEPVQVVDANVKEKVHRLELVLELFNICNSTDNLNELMDKVFKKVVEDVGAEAGSLWLINDTRTEIVCHVAEGPTRDKVQNLKLPNGTGVVGYVIDSGECQIVSDASKDSRFSNSVDQKTGFSTRSMICAPLIVEKAAIGAIQLLNKSTADGKFVEDDLNLLRLLCQSSATPIVNARLRASEKKIHELSVLLDISKEITGTLDLDGCMISVVNLCSKLIPYDRAVVALSDRDTVKISAISGKTTIVKDDPDVINLKNLLDGITKKKQDVFIPVAKQYLKSESSEKFIEDYLLRYHIGTLAVYRLFDEESDLGLFMMESRKDNLIQGSQSERIGILKNMLTVALRNAQLYASVPSLSIFGKSKKNSSSGKRKLIIGACAIIAAALISVIPFSNEISGTCEIQPSKKYVMFNPMDQAVISKVYANPYGSVKVGDTLLVFEKEILEQELFKTENRIKTLQHNIGNLKQQSKFTEYTEKELDLKLAHIEKKLLIKKINESVIIAPVSGQIITDEINNLAGRKFNKGDNLLEIVANDNIQIKMLVSEKEINNIRPEQTCRFRVPAYPITTFQGNVMQISYDVSKENEVFFPVIVSVNGNFTKLLPGMSGRGKINAGKINLFKKLWYVIMENIFFKAGL